MFGAIAGDIIGSVYEWNRIKTVDFPLFHKDGMFTDDTVMTMATASAILNDIPYASSYKEYGRRYPGRGYGGRFGIWLLSDSYQPYNSWGNGSAMRVSPVGFARETVAAVLEEAKRSAEVTHNHPEGIKGAQATALAIFLARKQQDKDTIKKEITTRFGYDLNRTIDQIRPAYSFNESCQGTVPEAIIAFLDSDSYEQAIRLAISLGGDSDTLACITGGMAEAYYQTIPEQIMTAITKILPEEFIDLAERFKEKYR